jgi:hypothetical protein
VRFLADSQLIQFGVKGGAIHYFGHCNFIAVDVLHFSPLLCSPVEAQDHTSVAWPVQPVMKHLRTTS